jgi:hypothetical protein
VGYGAIALWSDSGAGHSDPEHGTTILVGTYKIVSFIEEMEGKTVENMGVPTWLLIFTPTHVLVYTTKKKPANLWKKAALFDALLVGGKYRIEETSHLHAGRLVDRNRERNHPR